MVQTEHCDKQDDFKETSMIIEITQVCERINNRLALQSADYDTELETDETDLQSNLLS